MDLLIELVGPCDYKLIGIYDPSRTNMIPPGSYIIARKVDGLHVVEGSKPTSEKPKEIVQAETKKRTRKTKESDTIDIDVSDIDLSLSLDDVTKSKSAEDEIDWLGFEDDLTSQPKQDKKSKIWREGTIVFINDNGTTLKREMKSEKHANDLISLHESLGHDVFLKNARDKFIPA